MAMVTIERVPVEQIQAASYNPRKDLQPGDAEYDALRRSIDRFGSVQLLVWNRRSGNLVGGHQTFKILKAMGAIEVDVSVVELDRDDEIALNIALNKISGTWDQTKLFDLLSDLSASPVDLAFTGFDDKALAQLAADLSRPVPAFVPNTQPTLTDEPVTDAAVATAATEETARFQRGPRKVTEVTCPHCGAEFGV